MDATRTDASATNPAIEMVALARVLATMAHSGQTDKNGEPYIGHPARVAARVADASGQAVAWLHDAIEDTDLSLEDVALLFPAEVLDAIEAITHRSHEPRSDYYKRVRANPLALRVKLADIADNTDPERVALLPPATRARLAGKYQAALVALGGLS